MLLSSSLSNWYLSLNLLKYANFIKQGEVVGACFVIELDGLGGREKIAPVPAFSLLHYEEKPAPKEEKPAAKAEQSAPKEEKGKEKEKEPEAKAEPAKGI